MAGRVVAGLAALGAMVPGVVVFTAAPAVAQATPCGSVLPVRPDYKDVPYEDKVYDLPRITPLSTGAGIRVAVIDSGVDADHPQLRGHVEAGRDLLHGDDDARRDCVGHGTAVASIIAARPARGVAFQGLAPGVTIVPVRITEKEEINGEEVGADGTPAEFAEAITWAASRSGGDARVINLSVVMTQDNAEVRRAVAQVVADGVVVVAAAGNNGRPEQGNPTPYPAAYPGVIGVGAVTEDGSRADFSQHGEYVDLVAAGKGVTVAAPGRGHAALEGTSFAAPYVSATAALILQRLPTLTPAQVERRLTATADPAPGGGRSDEYGFGLLNPFRALTETLSVRPPSPAPAVMHTDDPAAIALAGRRAEAEDRSMVVGAVGLTLVLLAVLMVGVVRRGRRRGWRAAGS